jgi:endoglucanase
VFIKDKGKSFILFSLITFTVISAKPDKIQNNIIVDQFGYRPGDLKIAVITDPKIGFNDNNKFIPGDIYEVRQWQNDKVVFSGTLKEWHKGAIDFSSGDKGWWFDFTKLQDEGEYYIYDRKNKVASFKFNIGQDVYKDLLKTAMRVFYYQRINDAKEKPFAEEPWKDKAAFIGQDQDGQALYLYDKENKSLAKDLSGGWMDAGDYNKYVTFADSPIHMLLTAYEQNPKAFKDDYNIPESGNGIPDIIDEVKYELDWVKKMQDEDGGVIIKMGNIDYNVVSPPSNDKRKRYYGPKCSSSAIAVAGMFAHAAIVFSQFPALKEFADDLKVRALKAWGWYHNNPRSENCDSGEIKSGDADRTLYGQDEMEVVSAIYLFALTQNEDYNKVVKNNFYVTAPFYDSYLFLYFSHQGDALLYYTKLPNADEKTKYEILSQRIKQSKGLDLYRFKEADDLYMAYIPMALYTWGSNNPRAALGSANYDFITYKLDTTNNSRYMNRSLGILHYLHGVNPLGIVYLSNMYKDGAEYCADTIWHDWFSGSSKWNGNPPPGYVTGGPNFDYNGSLKEISIQPWQKSYKNWNHGTPENSWEITEPAIYYQASYVKLISKFINKK